MTGTLREQVAESVIPEAIDLNAVREKANEARRENERRKLQRTQRVAHEEALLALHTAHGTSNRLTTQMNDRSSLKAAAIGRAIMPIAGLGFGNDAVMFNGLPFDQASAAEQLSVSFALTAALHQQLKIALIRDGSLLDAESMQALHDLAEQHGVQVWIERVDEGDDLSIVMVDGLVRAEPAK